MTITADRPTTDALLDPSVELPRRAEELLDLLRSNASRTEADRRVAQENIDALAAAGLFKISVPKRLGGHEADFRTFLEVTSTLGRACGSTAWAATLMNVCGWLIGLYPDQAQRDVFDADPEARVCGVVAPNSTAVAVDGGLRVTGKWGFASGSLHSQWAMLGVPVVDESGTQIDQGMALIPMSELTIEDTWYVAGMRGTGSNTIVAEDVFVPAHRILSVTAAIEGSYPTEHKEEALYRSAFVPVLALVLVGPQLGLAQGALEVVKGSLAKGRGISYTFYDKSIDSGSTQINMAHAASLVDTAMLHCFRAAEDIDAAARSTDYMAFDSRARVRMDVGVVATRAREAMDLLLTVQGAGSFAEVSPLQRMWRDLETGSRHAVVNPAIAAEAYGRAMLGVTEQVTPLI
ncbi:acyl-CoA dehydrogenase family protein [Rhodococcus sp. SORGH_AS_0301]|uniref:acyl-CoA dehydrogenase family protein n=1 Tax=Rhodococcus sp. SORGH_AS_0301 TaxID=3041780 RepID=UPI00278AD623|nr:acyl-CoA dehydrogenase family protein [Rhodococcus sp. SORGH_AS_0301]MDQ1181820.1 3-hydroxy-9,10-secoandrosta-1,3,5(10)-triene-9,17-dione monooxygenase [Rhodococcus sp. SORGH_AS_0301]